MSTSRLSLASGQLAVLQVHGLATVPGVHLPQQLGGVELQVAGTGGPAQEQEGPDGGHVRQTPRAGLQQGLAQAGAHQSDCHLARAEHAGLQRLLQHHGVLVGLVRHLGGRGTGGRRIKKEDRTLTLVLLVGCCDSATLLQQP